MKTQEENQQQDKKLPEFVLGKEAIMPLVHKMRVTRPSNYNFYSYRDRFYYIAVVSVKKEDGSIAYKLIVTKKDYKTPAKWQPKPLQSEFATLNDAVTQVRYWERS